MPKYRFQVYLEDEALHRAAVDYCQGNRLSLSAGVAALLKSAICGETKPNNDEVLERLTRIEELLSHDESPVSHDESPVSHDELSEALDPLLSRVYGVVLIKDKAIIKFWTGKDFVDNPFKLKPYQSAPGDRTLAKPEHQAILHGGEVRYNDCERLLKFMGYPHCFQGDRTLLIAKAWVNAALIKG